MKVVALAIGWVIWGGLQPPPGFAQVTPGTNQLVQTGPTTFRLGRLELDRRQRTLRLPALVRLTNGVIEYALVTVEGKTHESLLVTEVAPTDIQVAALLLGTKPAAELGRTNSPIQIPRGARLRVDVEWGRDGAVRRTRLEDWIVLQRKSESNQAFRLQRNRWMYSGSSIHQGLFLAQEEGSIISLIRDPVALVNNPGIDRDDDDLHFVASHKVPPKDTPVSLILRFE